MGQGEQMNETAETAETAAEILQAEYITSEHNEIDAPVIWHQACLVAHRKLLREPYLTMKRALGPDQTLNVATRDTYEDMRKRLLAAGWYWVCTLDRWRKQMPPGWRYPED